MVGSVLIVADHLGVQGRRGDGVVEVSVAMLMRPLISVRVCG